MPIIEQPGLDDDLGSLLTLAKDASHLEGCACAACAEGSDKLPGGGPANAEDVVPGDTSSTVSAVVGGYIEGAIDTAGDHDWYRVNLTAGQTYTFATILTAAGLGDSVLALRDSAGVLIAENDDVRLGTSGYLYSEITFTATSNGPFFLDVSGFENDIGTFYLTVSAPVADSIAASAATTASLTLGTATNGLFDANGDHDWYAVTLTAGQSYVFTTSATGGAGDPDTVLTLRDASGNVLSYNDDYTGTYSRAVFTPTATGTYYLDVAVWGNDAAGAYRVQFAQAEPLQVYTNDQIAFQLTNTYWGGTARSWDRNPGDTITVNITALTADGQFLAREALNLWTDATGILFSEVTTGGDMVFDDNQAGAFASSTRIGGTITASTINVSESWLTSSGNTLRSYTFQAYVHEIGHALGLGHGGPYNGAANYPADASYLNDSWATTVMSYFDQTENTYFNGLGFTRQFAVTPMLADLIAVQNLYGVAATTRTGDTTYGFNNNSGRDVFTAAVGQTATSYTIVDHGGTDTLDYSGYSSAQRIDLNAEAFSNVGGRVGNVSIARGTVIENATGGSGADTLIGNAAANTLDGGAGINTLSGNAGNDALIISAAGSGSHIDGGAGSDTLFVTGTVTALGSLAGIERIDLISGATLTLTGTQLSGGVAVTSMVSGNGSLIVNMTAGLAMVTKLFNFTPFAGTITVNGTGGTDLIVLGNAANTVSGGDGLDQIKGGSLVDTVSGGLGVDKIIGGGGADILTGGSGNDVFKFKLASDSGTGAAADTITDFISGQDRLNFVKIDADAALAGDQAFAFNGTGAFVVNGLGQIRYVDLGADLRVEADVNGDGVADMHVLLVGAGAGVLTAADFAL